MKNTYSWLATFLVLFVLQTTAQAALLTTTQVVDFSTSSRAFSEFSEPSTYGWHRELYHNDSQSLRFDKFDPLLGDLKAVQLAVSGTVFYRAEATFVDTDIPFGHTAGMLLVDANIILDTRSLDSNSKLIMELPDTSEGCSGRGGVLSPAECGSGVLFPSLPLFSLDSWTDAAQLSHITGPGHWSADVLQYAALIADEVEYDDNSFVSSMYGQLSFLGSATLDYDYVAAAPPSAVPVPAAVWLFGTALVGLIGFGRHKSKAEV